MYKKQKTHSFFDKEDCIKLIRIMKLTFLLTLVIITQLSAKTYSQSTMLTINENSATIKELFEIIESQSEFTVFYKNNQFDAERAVNLNMKNATIAEVLNVAFINTDLTYKVLNKIIVITNKAQIQHFVTGQVTAESGEPLPGVNVSIKGMSGGTITDSEGKYSIEAEPTATLIFSFMGYATKEVEINRQSIINIVMVEDVKEMGEVVVIGYGVKKKSLVTGAISSVKGDEINNLSASRADQAIQGKISGIQVRSNSGSPGAGTKIRIRGTNSNGKSDPLYIVDGMKTGDINNIDPGDIESIEVLKDAASSAIYGTEGANGVILITTKSGKAEKNEITYDFQYAIQSLKTKMELMNADQYTQWMTEAGTTIKNRFNANTDWMSEVFEKAPMQKHHLSFSGGTQKNTFMLSGSLLDQDGIVGGNKANYNRFTSRLNMTSIVKKWLEVGGNFSFSHSNQKYVGEDDEYRGIVNNTLLIDPLTPVIYTGTPPHVQAHLDQGRVIIKDENGNYYGLGENADGEIVNPLALLSIYNNNIKQDKILGTGYATIKPFKGLTITSRVGVDLAYQIQHFWTPEYYFSAEQSNTLSTVDDRINKYYTWLWENFASYTKQFEGHNITAMLGYSAQKYQGPNFSLHSAGMVAEGDPYAYHQFLPDANDEVNGNITVSTQASLFGRLSYSFREKYLLEASLRRDGASEFPKDDKYALFPAISAGWIFSNEEFFAFDMIDYAKLRASWGANGSKSNITGNEDIELWRVANINYPDASGNILNGAMIAKLTNPNLLWERTEMLDIGIDLRFLQSKLTLSVDYYDKKTKDLITLGTGSLSVGNDYPFVNAGTVSNIGFDFELGYRNIQGELKYGATLNFSTLKNEVTELKVNAPVRGDNLRGYDLTWFEQGKPIWYFKGYKTDGILRDDAEAAAFNAEFGLTDDNVFVAGDPRVVDVNQDGEITASDQTMIGSPHPDLLFGGNIFLEYKGFDFNLSFQGTKGNDIFMGWFRTDRPQSNKPVFFYENRWTPENQDASFSRANNTSDYVYRSDLMIADGSYLRIKSIQLGYNLPAELLSKAGLNSVRAYVSLDDFFTFTGYKGLDPEAGSSNNQRQGVDRGLYPLGRKVLFGLSFKF